jgi:hypothetical protein
VREGDTLVDRASGERAQVLRTSALRVRERPLDDPVAVLLVHTDTWGVMARCADEHLTVESDDG